MRLFALLEDKRKSGAIWYKILRQSPKITTNRKNYPAFSRQTPGTFQFATPFFTQFGHLARNGQNFLSVSLHSSQA
jgi:hypothetical protein